jgi:hypothetical protein
VNRVIFENRGISFDILQLCMWSKFSRGVAASVYWILFQKADLLILQIWLRINDNNHISIDDERRMAECSHIVWRLSVLDSPHHCCPIQSICSRIYRPTNVRNVSKIKTTHHHRAGPNENELSLYLYITGSQDALTGESPHHHQSNILSCCFLIFSFDLVCYNYIPLKRSRRRWQKEQWDEKECVV